MGNAVTLAIHPVRLMTIKRRNKAVRAGVAVAVLRIARVDIALAAVAIFEIQHLFRRDFPGDNAIDVFIAHAFAPGGVRAVLRGIDIVIVGVCFIDIAVEAHRQGIARQRAAEANVCATRRAFFIVFRLVSEKRQRAVPVIGRAFGNDIHHAACSPAAVTRRRRAAQHFNTLDHFRRHPVGIAARVALAAPAIAHGITRTDRDAINQN